ncbi:MAG: hypothetical protein GY749_09530 [Desulfobacteraceae bacterium]|nr:hypothetical protein [Desulfobacteraceae bacterium]
MKIDTFVEENDSNSGQYNIQWQFPTFTINCTATDLEIAQKIITLIEETRANPAYRDTHLGGGHYRHMEPKGIDLSYCFADVNFSIYKCGECDHGYELGFVSTSGFYVSFHLANEELDDFLYGLGEIIENY